MAWGEHLRRAEERYRDGVGRLPRAVDPDARQKQLTRMGNAAYAAGLALVMEGLADEARNWFARAVDRYRESFADAPAGSWGRTIGAMKARVLAGDWSSAEDAARWTLDEGSSGVDSPIGNYAACLALLILGRDREARALADDLRTREGFPAEVGDALAMLTAQDVAGYSVAVEEVLESFETREEYLEDLPVADTVLVLQALANQRGMAAELESPLLPPHSWHKAETDA
jgi:hypothetical protein